MATITRTDIVEAFERLGQLAIGRGIKIEMALVGGALMVLAFDARESTRDVDAITLPPSLAATVREFAQVVARERGWPDDWLNDGAKGYLIGLSSGPVVFKAAGIEVRSPATAQVLAMKLSAWRDDVDISDAGHLLKVMSGKRQEVWEALEPYLVPGEELKAQYAFGDLWESIYGHD